VALALGYPANRKSKRKGTCIAPKGHPDVAHCGHSQLQLRTRGGLASRAPAWVAVITPIVGVILR